MALMSFNLQTLRCRSRALKPAAVDLDWVDQKLYIFSPPPTPTPPAKMYFTVASKKPYRKKKTHRNKDFVPKEFCLSAVCGVFFF